MTWLRVQILSEFWFSFTWIGPRSGCGVKYSDEAIFIIGGANNLGAPMREVWIYNPQKEFSRTRGPPLNTRRMVHSCGIMRDHEKSLIIVAGGYNLWSVMHGNYLDSVEIYNPTENSWHSGIKNFQHQTFSLFIFNLKTNQKAQHTTTRKHNTNILLYRTIFAFCSISECYG